MFGFLKDKLKKAISIFSKKAEEEAEEVKAPKLKEERKKSPKKQEKEKPKKETKSKEAKASEKKKGEKRKPEANKPRKEGKIREAEEEKEIEGQEEAEKEEPKEEEESEEAEAEEEPEKEEKKGFFGRLKQRFAGKEEKEEAIEETEKEAKEEEIKEEEEAEEEAEEKEIEEEKEEKKGFFGRLKEAVTTKTLSDSKFEDMFSELEMAMFESNIAVEVVEKIKEDLRKSIVDKKIPRGKFEDYVITSLHDSISSLFDVKKINLIKNIKEKKPYIIVFVGVNGSGKTTTIAKVAKLIQNNKLKPVIAAADTFRAAAIQQLEEHGSRLGVKVIKHDYGSDPASVAFDAIRYAEAKKLDVVLIDTAGRQHSNSNLMDEMKKIVRVSKPDLKIFIGESITGNDCVEQAKAFNDAIGIDGIVLTKADVDEKGGAAVSVSYVTGKPIIFIGMGQEYEDLREFDKKIIMENIGLA
ncbi:MAG: signal recognition particle-docking protein FtsY [Candidatus Woesearchaeota archaeon]|nr:signal recognition particle-docking protein FtsY [Candidatus Woesearchaeota archaeon]